MKSKGKREWSVYMVRCVDGSLYTGIAKDVLGRVDKHNKGQGAAYTRSHCPVKLLYQEDRFTRSKALIREAQIKRFPRPKKELLARESSDQKVLCAKKNSIHAKREDPNVHP